MEEFKTLNIHLSGNSDLKESVKIVLQSGLDPQMVISKSIVSMLKMFLSKDVATQCVAVRKLEDKVPIRDTPFVQCMIVVIKEHRLMSNMETAGKNIKSALSIVLSNAGHWYMARKSLPENKTNSTNLHSNLKIPSKLQL